MKRFIKIQIYHRGEACFDDIENSTMPTIVINIDNISALEERRTWGFCAGHSKYPFRVLRMKNDDYYYVPLDNANELEKLLIKED